MAEQNVNLYCHADGFYEEWDDAGNPTDAYTAINEVIADDDTTVLGTSQTGDRTNFKTWKEDGESLEWEVPSGKEITKVEVTWRAKETINATARAFLRLNSTDGVGATETLGTSYSTFTNEIACPSGAWSDLSDVSGLEAGCEVVTLIAKGTGIWLTQLYITVYYDDAVAEDREFAVTIPIDTTSEREITRQINIDYLSSKELPVKIPLEYCLDLELDLQTLIDYQIEINLDLRTEIEYRDGKELAVKIPIEINAAPHPSPTVLECERETTPTNASEHPIFTGIFNANAGTGGIAEFAQIYVSEESDYSTLKWDSGVYDIASVNDGNRCEEIPYAGTTLSSAPANDVYYWKIRFKDNVGTWSDWSANFQFSGIVRDWALSDYAFRVKVLLNETHPQLNVDDTFHVDFKTGKRQTIASNGSFNEAVQASGGYQVVYHDGKTHVVYLSVYDDDENLGCFIVSFDHFTQLWGAPVKIDHVFTFFDTHYFPGIEVDNAGYLHVFYGCHDDNLKYRRSKFPNISGSLPGEDTDWINPSTGLDETYVFSNVATYPVAINVPDKNRLYIMIRGSDGGSGNWRYHYYYTDDNGETWSDAYHFINHQAGNHFRVYCYGMKLDLRNNRLHIAFTFNTGGDVEQGVWYAYSDYDDGETMGYKDFYWADDTFAGEVNTNPLLTGPIDRDDSKAIVLRDGQNLYFIEDMQITEDGKPLVFYEHKWISGSPTNETFVDCALWNGSSWDKTFISDQVNAPLRVRRSSCPGMRDRDGIIHIFMPVNSKTHRIRNATADSFHTDISRSSGSNNYEMIDDGFNDCDGDGTYLFKTGTCRASFTSTRSIASNQEVISVKIELIARKVVNNYSLGAFVRISGTDYDITEQTVTSTVYNRFFFEWEINPATSNPWTIAEFNSLEFGFYGSTAAETIRISRVNLTAFTLRASDDEFFSAEMYELTTSDDGVNWTIREISQNSGIGVPIVNCKHHLTNNSIEVIWTSGHDIFYLADEPYGIIEPSGEDLRLLYDGVEIDRVLNYANLDKSRIYFAIQETIPINKKAGPADFEIYYGNKNVSDKPKSDPNQVFKLLFDNFEEMETNSLLNTQGGWTVSGGNARIYSSPASHANKVYAGINCVFIPAGANALKEVSGALINGLLSATFWNEGGLNRCYWQVENPFGDTFGFGLDDSSGVQSAVYHINGIWTTTSKKSRFRNMIEIAIMITPTTFSGWYDGELVFSIAAPIFLPNRIRFIAEDDAYFDYIRSEKMYATDNPIFTPQEEEYRGYWMDMAVKGNAHGIYAMDMKVEGFILINELPIPVEYRGGLSSEILIPIDTTFIVENTIRTNIEYICGVSVVIRTLIDNKGYSQMITNIPIEYLSDESLSIKTLIEWLDGKVLQLQTPIEHRLSIDPLATNIPVGFIGGSEFDLITNIEFMTSSEHAVKLLIENTGGIITTIRTIIGYAEQKNISVQIPIGYLQTVELIGKILIDWIGGIILQLPVLILIEWGLKKEINKKIPIEYQRLSELDLKVPVEYNAGRSITKLIPIENISSIDNLLSKINIEFLKSPVLESKIPIEWQTGLFANALIPIEFIQTHSFPGLIPVEYAGGIILQLAQKIPISWIGTISSPVTIPIEYSNYREIIGGNINVEWQVSRSIPNNILIEYGTEIESSIKLLAEWLGEINATANINVEYRGWLYADMRVEIEWGSERKTEIKIPVGYLASLASTGNIPIEYLGITITALSIIDAFIKIPELCDSKLTAPDIYDEVAKIAELSNQKISVPDIDSDVLKVAEIINSIIKGGN